NAHERREDLAYDTQHRLAFERRAVQTFLDLGQKLFVEGLDREPIDLGPLRTLRSHGIPPVGSSGRLPYVKIVGVADLDERSRYRQGLRDPLPGSGWLDLLTGGCSLALATTGYRTRPLRGRYRRTLISGELPYAA